MLRRITVAYTVNELGNWLGLLALTVAVFEHTRSALGVAALFVSIRFLPALGVTPVVAWLESLGRRGTLAALYGVQALTTAGLAALVLHPVLAPILAVGALDGVAALVAKALLRGTVSQRAEDEAARRRANGILNTCWAFTFAIGPAVGGVLTGSLGPSTVLLIDVVSFAITLTFVLDVPTPRTDLGRRRIADQVRAVARYVKANSELGWLLGTEAVALVFFVVAEPVEVVFIKSTLHAGDSGYGALLATWGGGTVVGSAVFARARRSPLGILLTAGTFSVAVGYLGIAASSALIVVCVFSFVGGVGNGMQWIALVTAVQDETPSSLQGRLMGVVGSMEALCPALGLSLGGAIAALSDARVTFVVAGGGAAVATCVFGLLAARGRGTRPLPAGAGAGPPPV
jgi:MFS family permease